MKYSMKMKHVHLMLLYVRCPVCVHVKPEGCAETFNRLPRLKSITEWQLARMANLSYLRMPIKHDRQVWVHIFREVYVIRAENNGRSTDNVWSN